MECREFQPDISVIENGIVLPRRPNQDAHSWGDGGVLREDGSFVQESTYDGGWIEFGGAYQADGQIDELKLECADMEAVYFGYFFPHWGHFLIDQNTRSWYLAQFAEQPEKQKKMKALILGDVLPSGSYLDFFLLLGLKKEQLYLVDHPVRCSKIIVPHHAARPCKWYSPTFRLPFETAARMAISQKKAADQDWQKVYFTRQSFSKASKDEFGEGEIEAFFQAYGFVSVAPERHSLASQIQIWNEAKEIACLNGSIPLNLLFCLNKDLHLIILNKYSMRHVNMEFVSAICAIEPQYLDVYKEPLKKFGIPKGLGAGPFLLTEHSALKEWAGENSFESRFNWKKSAAAARKQEWKYFKYVCAIRPLQILRWKAAQVLKRGSD